MKKVGPTLQGLRVYWEEDAENAKNEKYLWADIYIRTVHQLL